MDNAILEHLGISANAAQVYLALFSKGTLTATELANLAGVPRGAIYRVLDELMAKGLCVLKPGKVKKYAVTDPDLNLKGLIDVKRQEIEAADQLQSELRDQFIQVMAHERGPLEYIEILRDPKLINAKYLELVNKTEHEALAFVKEPFINQRVNTVREQIESQMVLYDKQRVRMRAIYQLNQFYELDTLEDYKDKETRSYIRLLQSLHFSQKYNFKEIRITENLPLKAAVFDEQDILLLLPDPITQMFSVTSLHIQHRDLGVGLKMLFESIWQTSMTWEQFLEKNGATSSYNIKLEDL